MCAFTKMCFLCVNLIFQVLTIWAFRSGNTHEISLDVLNLTRITFSDISKCKNNEFYDLDIFSCVACGKKDENLQSTANKLSCECAQGFATVAIYDTQRKNPICTKECDDDCQVVRSNGSIVFCEYKLINFTQSPNYYLTRSGATSRPIRLIYDTYHINGTRSCNICDLKYNFHYLDYCIGNEVLKPYLKYNSFWQSTSRSDIHFGDLKFVALFCLALHNNTACNQLANLCIISHFSADKSSPCSAFLLTQLSDVVIKYASMDENLQATKPSLFYKKGKTTAKMFMNHLSLRTKRKGIKRLELFSTVYALDGTLRRWGAFKISQINLCQMNAFSDEADLSSQWSIYFGRFSDPIHCRLTTENLIDLARIYANDNFFSIFLNVSEWKGQGPMESKLIILPVLIEDISADNLRPLPEEWQLVKRFQLIEAQPRQLNKHTHQWKMYQDDIKLSIYRSIRYVEDIELHYEIYNDDQIGLPLVKLRYRHLDLTTNVTLNEVHPFKLQITFARAGEDSQRKLIFETLLPAFLLVALMMALLQLYNYRLRRAGLLLTATASDFCSPSSYLIEFLLHFISYAANAMLLSFVSYMFTYPLQFLAQRTVEITLPIMKDDQSLLEILIYAAFLFKLLFVCAHFWHISRFDLFLIDWERPRSCENNHFILKNNLETSSVCSSVRTFASENVSAWRIFYVTNEWIRLSVKQKHSVALQGFLMLPLVQIFITERLINKDLALQLFIIIIVSIVIYITQVMLRKLVWNRIFGDPLQKFIDLCSLCNISVFMLLEHSFGYYIHGRSPNGFADTDMYSMLVQIQRGSQQRCPRKGLLRDSDQQSYIILPPLNLRIYLEKLLAPFERPYIMSQQHFQKEIHTIDAAVERSTAAYTSLNRFLCAFIDHAIKDMDYIIKEKTLFEKLLNCEFENYLTENVIVSLTHAVDEDVISYGQPAQNANKNEFNYAFLDRKGITIAHPAFPRPMAQQQTPFPVDIGFLENSTDFAYTRQRILHDDSGNLTTSVYLTRDRKIESDVLFPLMPLNIMYICTYIIHEKYNELMHGTDNENFLIDMLMSRKGTFYIDNAKSFDRLLLYGNSFNIIIMELTLLIAFYMLTRNLIAGTVVVYIFNKSDVLFPLMPLNIMYICTYIIHEKYNELMHGTDNENFLIDMLMSRKGTFYIDNAKSFDRLLLYGNSFNIIIMELTLLIAFYMLTRNLIAGTVVVYIFNKLLQSIFQKLVRHNVTTKTSIDKRFLM